jgi:alpha-mannosidase
MITLQNAHREERILLMLPRIEALIYPERSPIHVEAWKSPGEPVPVTTAMKASYSDFAVGQNWGQLWSTTWFRLHGKVPIVWSEKKVVVLVRFAPAGRSLLQIEGFTAEGLVYQDGKPITAINQNRAEIEIGLRCKGGESFLFLIEAAANGNMTQDWNIVVPQAKELLHRLYQAELAVVDEMARDFYFDFRVASEAMVEAPENSERRAALRCALHEAAHYFDSGKLTKAKESLGLVLSPVTGKAGHRVTAVGHAHIDTAWLWPLREALRKCARTFSTMVDYLEKRPEFRFSCSQAQHYAWMKRHYPTIFQGITKAVKRGQWEPIGSMGSSRIATCLLANH